MVLPGTRTEKHIPIEFALQAGGSDPAEAARAEELGFVAYYLADHPGSGLNPLAGLSAAAAVTSEIRLGAYVLNVGVREPFHIAADVAALDVVSQGRAILGLGAGHTPSEWRAVGAERPGPRERIDRLVEVTSVVQRLLAGETVTFHGEHVGLVDAHLQQPRPVQSKIPLLLGGGNPRLLELAGREADIVGLTGLGKTKEDGHRHDAWFAPSRVDAQVERVLAAAKERDQAPEFEALVQVVDITDDRQAAASAIEGVPDEDLLAAPYVLLGTHEEIAAQMLANRERWGITRYAVRSSTIDDIEPLIGNVG